MTNMIPRNALLHACPYCSARYALARARSQPQPRRLDATPARQLTTRAVARPRLTVPAVSVLVVGRVAGHPRLLAAAETLRTYATAADEDDEDGFSEKRRRPRPSTATPSSFSHQWPKARYPTPYEVFDQPKDSAYQKKRFYALAKMYHPDLHHNVPAHLRGLAPSVLIARYRLIVAANDILSDPQRRKKYDHLGLGWEEHEAPPSYSAGYASKTPAEQERERQQAVWKMHSNWRTRPGSAANNATWEDWERWRQDNGFESKEKQEEQFMSNGGFAVIVLGLVFLGGWAQLTRAGSSGTSLVSAQNEHNQHISATLRSQQIANAPLSRQDRVGSFLERREGWYDIPKGR